MLATVREDHELVAEHIRTLESLHGAIARSEGPHLEHALQVLREINRSFRDKLLPHFQSEEQGLFLFFSRHLPRGSTLVYELEAEHGQMCALYERLGVELSFLRHAKHRRRSALAELQTLCAQIATLLSHHADRETITIARCLGADGADPPAHECEPCMVSSA
jgi:hemerythrin-like domain-containing protein